MNPTLEEILQPLRETAASTAKLLQNLGTRLDALALDLAKDGGKVVRDAQAFATAARDEAVKVRGEAVKVADVARDEAMKVRDEAVKLAGAVRDEATKVRDEAVKLGGVARDEATKVRDEAVKLAGVARDEAAKAADAAKSQATTTRDQFASFTRATPRMMKIATTAAALFARQRWLRLAQAARTGSPDLRPEDHRDLAARTAAYAAELRGGIAKIGQLASCRPDLIGNVWAGELAKLQDEVPPVDAAAIRARIEAELGKPIDEMFAEFDDVPIAAASLAQVHAAVLRDGEPDAEGRKAAGSRVVVKVQVPGIEDVIAADIAALKTIATTVGEVPGVDLPTLTSELARALTVELDYEAEADSLWAYTGSVSVPRPFPEASSKRVLTMSRIDGEKLTTWLDKATVEARDKVLGELVSEVAAQILVRGQVHADPHPGNFLVTPDGKLALLDFGCMLELGKPERAAYARLVLAIAGGNTAAAGKELAALGFSADDPEQLVDLTGALIGAMKPGMNAGDLDWQAAFADQIAQAKQLGGLVIPRSFVLLGRVLASVAGLMATYKPKIEIHPIIARHLAMAIAQQ
jgi:predicted unusual protein kinase regulating ubiquinone biosynthesis (AarF/ABC1/UbiB family)